MRIALLIASIAVLVVGVMHVQTPGEFWLCMGLSAGLDILSIMEERNNDKR